MYDNYWNLFVFNYTSGGAYHILILFFILLKNSFFPEIFRFSDPKSILLPIMSS